MLRKGNKEDLNKWTDKPYSWIGKLTIVKMSVLPKLIYRFHTVPITTPARFFVDIDKLILNVYGKAWSLQ